MILKLSLYLKGFDQFRQNIIELVGINLSMPSLTNNYSKVLDCSVIEITLFEIN